MSSNKARKRKYSKADYKNNSPKEESVPKQSSPQPPRRYRRISAILSIALILVAPYLISVIYKIVILFELDNKITQLLNYKKYSISIKYSDENDQETGRSKYVVVDGVMLSEDYAPGQEKPTAIVYEDSQKQEHIALIRVEGSDDEYHDFAGENYDYNEIDITKFVRANTGVPEGLLQKIALAIHPSVAVIKNKDGYMFGASSAMPDAKPCVDYYAIDGLWSGEVCEDNSIEIEYQFSDDLTIEKPNLKDYKIKKQ